ncbi:hypothetical protein [Shewanella woodyi]|uniref:hypothetical protein n=1 Tax=Shewanella woodyi TaxID=60961 RepID=UPI0037487D18
MKKLLLALPIFLAFSASATKVPVIETETVLTCGCGCGKSLPLENNVRAEESASEETEQLAPIGAYLDHETGEVVVVGEAVTLPPAE